MMTHMGCRPLVVVPETGANILVGYGGDVVRPISNSSAWRSVADPFQGTAKPPRGFIFRLYSVDMHGYGRSGISANIPGSSRDPFQTIDQHIHGRRAVVPVASSHGGW
jgi:hypothetical protein